MRASDESAVENLGIFTDCSVVWNWKARPRRSSMKKFRTLTRDIPHKDTMPGTEKTQGEAGIWHGGCCLGRIGLCMEPRDTLLNFPRNACQEAGMTHWLITWTLGLPEPSWLCNPSSLLTANKTPFSPWSRHSLKLPTWWCKGLWLWPG